METVTHVLFVAALAFVAFVCFLFWMFFVLCKRPSFSLKLSAFGVNIDFSADRRLDEERKDRHE